MRALIFATEAEARTLSARVDVSLDIPRCECSACRNTGAPPGLLPECCCTATPDAMCPYVTLQWALPFAHPTDGRWAYPIDATSEAHLTASEAANVVVLPADWFPSS